MGKKNKAPNNFPLSFMGKRNRQFKDSAFLNSEIFLFYFQRLMDIALSVFDYENIPDTIDTGYLEYLLMNRGAAVITVDKVVSEYIVLELAETVEYNYAHKPSKFRGISPTTGYTSELLDKNNAVVVYNNLSMCPSYPDLMEFARRLYVLQSTVDINANAQKTPVLVRATESQRLTMLNLYQQYDGNQPFIFADKSLDTNALTVLSTQSPFNADKLDELKNKVWNEALTYLGVSNVAINKKERLITDEVTRSQGGVIASRFSRLQSRKTAFDQFNKIFGENVKVNFREDLNERGGDVQNLEEKEVIDVE